MIKYIVSAGCSWVEGMGCYYHKNRMSSLLANKYDAEDINLAKPAGSNDRSVRRLVTWAIQNKDRLDETIFIYGLTAPGRYELWDDEMGWYADGSYQRYRVDDDIRRRNRTVSNKTEKFMLKYHYNKRRSYDRTLYNVLNIMGVLDSFNCKYLIFDAIAFMRPNFDGWDDYMGPQWLTKYKDADYVSRMEYLSNPDLIGKFKDVERNPLAYGKEYVSSPDYDLLQYVMNNPLYQEILTRKNFYNKQSWAEFCLPQGSGLAAAECEFVKADAEKQLNLVPDYGHPNQKCHKLWLEVLLNYADENKLW